MTEVSTINIGNITDQKNQKKHKNAFKVRYLKILNILQDQFPLAFPKEEVRILKLGIHKDLKELTKLSAKEIYLLLSNYCRSRKYQQSHVEGANRYKLAGEVVIMLQLNKLKLKMML